jgi:hypothetical protein
MIQRIQSIFLFVAAGLCVAFLFLPTWMVVNNDVMEGKSYSIHATPMAVSVESSSMSLDNPFTTEALSFTSNTFLTAQFALTIGAALLLLVTIFLFNNRPLQIKMGYVGVILLMGVNVLMVPIRGYLQGLAGDPTIQPDMYQSVPQWGLAAPFLALLLTWFAIKRIQKDEKLVQGMDRFR